MDSQLLFSSKIVDITPLSPTPLAGWTTRTQPFEAIDTPLEANIIMLQQEQQKLFIISVDTLYLTRDLKLTIINSVKSITNIDIKEEQLLFIATHTHFAPMLDNSKPTLGKVDTNYEILFMSKITNALIELLTSIHPISVRLFLHTIKINNTINRRKKAIKLKKILPYIEVIIGPNKLGRKNNYTYLIELKNQENTTIGIMWNYACHPVNFYNFNHVSSNFIGVIRKNLRLSFKDKDLPICFLQGFAGNIRSDINTSIGKNIIRFLKSIFFLPDEFETISKENYYEWANSLTNTIIDRIKSTSPFCPAKLKLASSIKLENLSEVMSGKDISTQKITFQKVVFSDELHLIAISAEPSFEFEELLNKQLNTKKTIYCGYIDSIFGYLPTDRQVKEGGYEAKGFMTIFNMNASFKKRINNFILNAVKAIDR